ncbi:MAG: flippase [Candidatus Nanohaloarchaeota archaeon QJJ-7]|nr:flippase [Candidatus Nanohaloarchaeota archaeon QJJ-7]
MDGEEALSKVGVGSAAIIAGFAIGIVLQYLIKVVLARFLGPGSYGVFVQGLALVQAAAILSLFGLHMSLPRFISYYKGKKERRLIGETAGTALSIVIPSAIVVSSVLYLSSRWISATVFSEPALVQPLQIFALSVLPLSLFYLAVGFIRGRQNARYKVYLDDLLFPGVELVLVLVFFGLGYGVEGAISAYLISVSAVVIASYWLYRKLADGGFKVSKKTARKLLFFSWPLFILSILTMASKWIDVLMMGWLKESVQVGVYEVAFAVAGVLPLFLSSLKYMFLPVISELYGKGDLGEILELYRTSTRWIFTLVLPLFAGMLIFPSEILNVLFGQSYTAGALALAILSIGYFFHVAVGPAGNILLASGKTRLLLFGMLVLTVVDVVLNLFLIPRYGMVGAAIAMTSGLLAGNAVLLFLAVREVGGHPYTGKYLKSAVSVLVASIPVYGLKMVIEPGLIESVLLGVLLVLIYGSFLYLSGGVQKEDWQMMDEVVGAVRG